MTKAADYLVKSAILSIRLMMPKPIAAAVAGGMDQQRMLEPSAYDPEGYVEMPVFEPVSVLRHRKRRRRVEGG